MAENHEWQGPGVVGMKPVHILPTLPPPHEGVGTYALALADALSVHGEIESVFVVGDPRWRGGGVVEARVVPVSRRRAAGLCTALTDLDADAVIGHYVNYGYQKRGCPIWLVRGLERWKKRDASRRLVTIFHEVYAFGPPWRSSFWLSPVQRWLARRLLALSDAGVASLRSYVARLGRAAPAKTTVLPVFSTVGELEQPAPIEERSARLAIFGGSGVRSRAYGPFLPALERACGALGIEEIVDVGPPGPPVPSAIAGCRVHVNGALPAEDVSMLLARSRAGFLAYPPAFLPKSTIFAAYAAHGVAPVCAWDRFEEGEGVLPHEHYVPADGSGLACAGASLALVARAAHAWYRSHSVAVHAAWLRGALSR